MQKLQVIEAKGIRVLTTKQLSQAYEATTQKIKQNFTNNKSRFVEGKHYIALRGEELKAFKNQVEKIDLVDGRASHLYLWTEKGALLHAKSLNTDKAWEVYDYLVDFYFRAKAQGQQEETTVEPVHRRKEQIPHMENPIGILQILLKVAEEKKIQVKSMPFKALKSALHGDRIGIRMELTVEEAAYELAWELSHAFIHYDGGDVVQSPLSKDYNEQADRAAGMIITILNQKARQM